MRIRAVSSGAFLLEKISAGLAMAELALVSVSAISLLEEFADQSFSFRGLALPQRTSGTGLSFSSAFPGAS